MFTIIISILIGALLGVGLAGALYILMLGKDFIDISVAFFTDRNSGDIFLESSTRFLTLNLVLVCIISGAIIGFVYGLIRLKNKNAAEAARRNIENSEVAKKQHEKWAEEVKSKALKVYNKCEINNENIVPLIQAEYKADSQMNSILCEMREISELKGQIDSLAEDIKEGGTCK